MWQNWVNLILGIWVVLSAYIGMTASNLMTNYTIVGIAVAILAAWGAFDYQSQREHSQGGAMNRPMRT